MRAPVTRAVETFEVSLKAFILKEGRALFVREADTGFWELPGGRIDQGEAWQLLDAILQRELDEELGPDFKVDMTKALGTLMRQRPHDQQHILQLVRLCHYRSGELRLSGEHQAFQWLSPTEAQALAFPERSTYATGLQALWQLADGA
ncbi:MAG: hypothetical protein RL291_1318 [Pseudomonadota bacterium]